MTTFDLHPWNFMPVEILEHIFSFLPVRERHNILCTCKLWATTVSSASVWSFTEVHCDLDETEKEDGYASDSLLQMIHPYMDHIRYLKLVLHVSLEVNQRLACIILDMTTWKRCRLQGLQIVCYGRSPLFYSGQDILQNILQLFLAMDEATMQHIDLRQMPFVLDSGTISLMGSCSPNLRTLLINNHAFTMLRSETIIEVVRSCPKLSTLGVSYFALSPGLFQEMLRPNREPFKYLEVFYDGLDHDIPEDSWASVRERYPNFRVGLEFAKSITEQRMTEVLKPYLPISQLCFNALTDMADQVMLAADFYAGTLEKLVVHSASSLELNTALIRVASTCSHLEEIHCFCVVAYEVVAAFQHHHPHLKKYTLSTEHSSLTNL